MNMVIFLHRIRHEVVDLTGDANTFVRMDADRQHPDELVLSVFTGKAYYPFTLDTDDLRDDAALDGTYEFVIERIKDEHVNGSS